MKKHMKIIYKIEADNLISVEADTGDPCTLGWISHGELRRRAHALVDGKKDELWSDGHPEEPTTRLYAAVRQRVTQIEEIRDMDKLCDCINQLGFVFYEINVKESFTLT